MERSTELVATLQLISAAVSDGDADTMTGVLSARDGLLSIGTDPDDDVTTIKAMLSAQAAAGVKVRAGTISAFEEGTVGWVADRGTFVMSDDTEVPLRITAVFLRENGMWRLVQERVSIAITNEVRPRSDPRRMSRRRQECCGRGPTRSRNGNRTTSPELVAVFDDGPPRADPYRPRRRWCATPTARRSAKTTPQS